MAATEATQAAGAPETGTHPGPEVLAYRAVLVPIDGSMLAELALGPAFWLARRFGAEVHAVAVAAPPEKPWLARYLAALTVRWPELPVRHAQQRDAVAGVREAADALGPALLCMATHGWNRGHPIFGTEFTEVAAHTGRPLVAVGAHARVPPDGDDGRRRIVACVDGTPAAEAVLADAAAWARHRGWRLSLVTVAEPAPASIVPGAHRYRAFGPDDPDAYLAGLRDRPELAGVDVDTAIVWDPLSPRDGLLGHLAERPATLLALATHARRGAARLWRGNETAEIIHDSPVPVLVRPLGHPGTS